MNDLHGGWWALALLVTVVVGAFAYSGHSWAQVLAGVGGVVLAFMLWDRACQADKRTTYEK